MSDAVDFRKRSFKDNPYPYYEHLRMTAPVARVQLSRRRDAWLVTRYADVSACLMDERLVKDRVNAISPGRRRDGPWAPRVLKPLLRNMLDRDPPDHTRLRALVHRAFTPRTIAAMEERIRTIAVELLRRAAQHRRVDIIRDVALPLPAIVIAEMLGIPPADRHRFHRWSARIVASDPTGWRAVRAVPAIVAFLRYIRKLVRARKAQPRDDLVTALVQAEAVGDRLDEDELVAMIFLLLVAGHETTANLIGNGMFALLTHPASMNAIRADRGLIPVAVEEMLRYYGPLEMATERYAREDIELAGTVIPRGAQVFAVLASANRDEEKFERPDEFDIRRQPNRHIAFGQGIHFCLGASLARLEGRIAIAAMMDHFAELRLAAEPQALRWRGGLVLRGLESLPVVARRAADFAVGVAG